MYFIIGYFLLKVNKFIKFNIKYMLFFLQDEVEVSRNSRRRSDGKQPSGKLKGILKKPSDKLNDSGLGESFVGVCV